MKVCWLHLSIRCLCTFSLFSAFRKCGGSGSGGYYGRGSGNGCHDAYEADTGDEDDENDGVAQITSISHNAGGGQQYLEVTMFHRNNR